MIFWVSSLFLLPQVDFSSLAGLTAMQWFWLAFAGLNTLIAYNALAYALSKLPGSIVGPIITLNPLLTIAFMFLLLETSFSAFTPDRIYALGILGALLVVAGVVLVVRPTSSKNMKA